MRRPQVSIGGLLVVVIVIAVGLAAIRSGSDAWSGVMVSIMAFTMICSLLGVVLTRGTRRVYWCGFAFLGWSYLLLIYVPWLFDHVGQFLMAPHLFEVIDQALHPAPEAMMGFRSMALGGFSGGTSQATDFSPLVRIGVSLEALLWAYLGGWVARYFASGREPQAS